MSQATTRLVIDNSTGVMLTTLEMNFSDGQYFNLRVRLKEGPQRTIHQTELAALKRAREMIDHMLAQESE